MKQRYRDGKKSGWVCPPCANMKAKAYRLNQPEKWLDNKLWTFYRIRLADYQRMVAEQDGRCAACGIHAGELKGGMGHQGLVVDHDHRCCDTKRYGGGTICGKCVRGLLCQQCNTALGMVNDDPDRLDLLATYVRKWVD